MLRLFSSAVRWPAFFGSIGKDSASQGIDGVSDGDVSLVESEVHMRVVVDQCFDAFDGSEDGAVILFGKCAGDFGIRVGGHLSGQVGGKRPGEDDSFVSRSAEHLLGGYAAPTAHFFDDSADRNRARGERRL